MLQKMVNAKLGQPANTVRLGDDLKEVQKLYGSRGFVTAAIKVDAQFDDAASTVALHLDVKEGYEYHMGDLRISRPRQQPDRQAPRRLEDSAREDLRRHLPAANICPQAHNLLPPTLDWDVSSHVTANVRDKTVDVDLIYSVKAPK